MKTALDSMEAFAIANAEIPALIISNILLPMTDGVDLIKQVRKDLVLSAVPIILLTCLPDAHDVVQSLLCGADTIVMKPYDEMYFLKKIDSLLNNNHVKRKLDITKVPFNLVHDEKVYHIPASQEKIQDFLDTICEQIINQNLLLKKTQSELQDRIARLEDEALGQTSDLRQSQVDLLASGKDLNFAKEHLRKQDALLGEQQCRINENEERFQIAFDYAGVGIMIISPDLNLLDVNNEMCAIIGYSKEELLKKTLTDITYPEDLELIEPSVQKSGDVRLPVIRYEKRYLHRDGYPIWTSVSSVLLHFESGEPRFYVSHIKDIRERKKAEMDLRIAYNQIITTEEELWLQYNENREKTDNLLKSEWKYQNLFESVQEGI